MAKPVHKRMEQGLDFDFFWLTQLWRETPASYEYDVRDYTGTLMTEEYFEQRYPFRVTEESILPTSKHAGHF
jgi:hypothetical protein